MNRDPLASTAPITPGLPKADAMAALLCKLDSQVNKHLAGVTQRGPTATAASATNDGAVTPSPQHQQQRQQQTATTQPTRPFGRARWLTPTLATVLVSMLCGPALVWWGVSAGHEGQSAGAAPAWLAPNKPAGAEHPQAPTPSLAPGTALSPSPSPTVAAETAATSSPAPPAKPICSDAETALGLCRTTTR
jgi:hypothetical protein